LSPADTVEFYRLYYGPINRAFAALEPDRQTPLRADLEQLWSQANEATDKEQGRQGQQKKPILVIPVVAGVPALYSFAV
jgi:hypothetical protein